MKIPSRFAWVPANGKIPAVNWRSYTDQAPTEQEYSAWNSKFANSGKAIICGKVSGIFVLDDDGSEELKQYAIPRTVMQRTPRGGKHYLFKWTDELDGRVTTKAGILDKADVRGHGGIIAFYGWSVGPNVAPLASPPKWLVDLLPKKGIGEVKAGVIGTLADLKPGNRNQSFASLAGGLRAKGYSVEEMYNLLEAKANEVSFPLEELRLVCNSIGRYEPGVSPVAVQSDHMGESIESFLAESEPVKWICKPFIAEQGIGIIGGLPESRKSWVLVDLAVECARGGGLWLNKFPVEGKRVLLIDQERSKAEVQRRLKAVIAGKGLSVADIRDSLFVRSGTSTRIDQQQSYDSLRKEISDLRPDLILVDSLATFHTKNESSRFEIQEVMERIKQLRSEFNCAIIVIHHETKAAYQNKREGAEPSYLDLAGNVAIPAAAEFCMNISKHDDGSSFCFHTKSTQGTKVAPFMVRVRDAKPDGSEIVVEAF